MADFPLLAAPLEAGRLRLRNRIVHAAMLTRFAEDQRATDRLIAYHANRAAGGAALIVTEPVNALPMQATRGAYLNVHSDAGIPDLARLADAVHAHDCRIIAQLQERGRGNYDMNTERRPVAPSALPDDLAGVVPRALTTGEVEAMIDDFAAAAQRLERAGFDGVEISAGHGHLFHQFLSAHANHRTDRFGGDADRRMAFLDDTIDAIRDRCGTDFIVALKLPAEDGDEDGIGLEDAEHITRRLVSAGRIDLLSFVWGSQNRYLHWHVPDGRAARVPYAEKTARLRRAANGVPVMVLGRIVDPNEAEAALAAGEADLVGLGRALVADPAWPVKALSGRTHAIRSCVSCNTCWSVISRRQPLVCDANPDLATPFELPRPRRLLPPSKRRKVVVVGGGPAGAAMAASAAGEGHEVVLFHRGADIGGRAAIAARLPGGEGLQGVYDLDAATAREAGARLELGVEATVEDVLSLAPDDVVLATGAASPWPSDAPGDEMDDTIAPQLGTLLVRSFGHAGQMGRHLVLMDREDSIWCYRAVEHLATRFEHVTVLCPCPVPAQADSLVIRQGLLELLAELPVQVLANAVADPLFEELAEGRLGYRDSLSGERKVVNGVDALTHASPRISRLDLAEGLEAAGLRPIVIGDALRPRSLLQAVAEGRHGGRLLGGSRAGGPASRPAPGPGTGSS